MEVLGKIEQTLNKMDGGICIRGRVFVLTPHIRRMYHDLIAMLAKTIMGKEEYEANQGALDALYPKRGKMLAWLSRDRTERRNATAIFLATVSVHVVGFHPMYVSSSQREAVKLSEDIQSIMKLMGHQATLDTRRGVYINGKQVVTSISDIDNVRGIGAQAIVADVQHHPQRRTMLRSAIIPPMITGTPGILLGNADDEQILTDDEGIARAMRAIQNI